MGPAYGGEGGGNSWVVHAHRRPRRDSRCSAISVDAQRGHESCAGNVTIPHAAHRLPISRGSSDGHVKTPSAIGTRATACIPISPMEPSDRTVFSPIESRVARIRAGGA